MAYPSLDNSPSTLPTPFTYEQPMARAIDPAYAHKILEGNHQPATADRFQREIYRKANVNNVNIEWWLQDNTESIALAVSVPTYPYFHPKDCALITALIGQESLTYGYWDGLRWITTNVPMEIKSSSTPLYLRSAHVKTCSGGPTAKRRLSNPFQDTPTAVRTWNPVSRPPISPIRYQIVNSDSSSPVRETAQPTPAQIVSTDIDVVPSASMSLSVLSASQPNPCTFPLKYACDMNKGFLAMEESTEQTNWNVWKTIRGNTSLTAALEVAISHGHNKTNFVEFPVAVRLLALCSSVALSISNGVHPSSRTHMAPALSHSLTKEYLEVFPLRLQWYLSDLAHSESQHDSVHWERLQVDHLNAILRAHHNRRRLRNSPQVYEQAVLAILGEPNLKVNWKYVVHSVGSPSAVDLKIQLFYNKTLLQLPPEHLQLLKGPPSPDIESSPPSPAISHSEKTPTPPPMTIPETSVVHGKESEVQKLTYSLIKYDPQVDTEAREPKVVVVSYFGDTDHHLTVTRFNCCDFEGHTYHGVRVDYDTLSNTTDSDSEDEGVQPDNFKPDSLRVTVPTQNLVEMICLNIPIPAGEFFFCFKIIMPLRSTISGKAYQIGWSIPGFPDDIEPFGPYSLYTSVPGDNSTSKWACNVNDEHQLPFGPCKALRIQLHVRPYEKEDAAKVLTPAQQGAADMTEYLLQRHDGDPVVKSIHLHHKTHASKHAGVSPARWDDWVEKIALIESCEHRVSESTSVPDTIRKKIINKTHIGHMLCTSSGWVASCIEVHKLIKKNRSKSTVIALLAQEDRIIGINRFHEELKAIIQAHYVDWPYVSVRPNIMGQDERESVGSLLGRVLSAATFFILNTLHASSQLVLLPILHKQTGQTRCQTRCETRSDTSLGSDTSLAPRASSTLSAGTATSHHTDHRHTRLFHPPRHFGRKGTNPQCRLDKCVERIPPQPCRLGYPLWAGKEEQTGFWPTSFSSAHSSSRASVSFRNSPPPPVSSGKSTPAPATIQMTTKTPTKTSLTGAVKPREIHVDQSPFLIMLFPAQSEGRVNAVVH
ncbi:hypothetical protein C8R45DRAFT_927688 [Mycena sanguinolenta]|nr:hypothetical protein C8R45DRAFT_927688 [Mycena sanguinolenta]